MSSGRVSACAEIINATAIFVNLDFRKTPVIHSHNFHRYLAFYTQWNLFGLIIDLLFSGIDILYLYFTKVCLSPLKYTIPLVSDYETDINNKNRLQRLWY